MQGRRERGLRTALKKQDLWRETGSRTNGWNIGKVSPFHRSNWI